MPAARSKKLNSLGFNYALIEDGARKAKKASGIKRSMKDAAC